MSGLRALILALGGMWLALPAFAAQWPTIRLWYESAALVPYTSAPADKRGAGLIIELLEAEGLRDKFVVCCGGPRITHELAKELGYDAGFGAGKYADDVASFAVTEMVKRGMGK